MSRFLEKMAERSRDRATDLARRRLLQEVRESALSSPPPRPLGGFGEVFDLIAEIKPRSPAEGAFADRSSIDQGKSYEDGGAAVISVLAEPSEFGGSIELVRAVAAAVTIPVLAKDFLTDPIQVYEAREAGAGGVLLIARILDDRTLTALLDAVVECGCFAILEAFDESDLDRVSEYAIDQSDLLVGVNCRDLDTLQVVPERHVELADRLPQGPVAVAESAIGDPADVERVVAHGYRAALVGSALMRAQEPGALVGALIEAGRRAAPVAS
jgi:indole-3-glycerol phosphate synthase